MVYILLPLQIFAQETYTNCGNIPLQTYEVQYDINKSYYWNISGGEIVYNNGIIDGIIEILSNKFERMESKPLYC